MATCAGASTSIIECSGGGDAGIWYVLNLIIDIMTGMLGLLAVIGIILFGIQYATSSGDVTKTTKAKRRILEIVIGIAAYLALSSFLKWILPTDSFDEEIIETEGISLSIVKESIYVNENSSTKVTFKPADVKNKSYSLSSSDEKIAKTSGHSIFCMEPGTAKITATSSTGKTATGTITCEKRPVKQEVFAGLGSEKDDRADGGTTNPDTANLYFSGLPLEVGTTPLTKEQVEGFIFDKNPTYADIVNLAAQHNITKNSDRLVAILSWTQGEGYWNAAVHPDKYLSYLCSSVIINNILYDPDYLDPLRKFSTWGEWYSPDNVRARAEQAKTNQAALRPIYLAFTHRRTGIGSCYGNDPGKTGTPEGTIYTGKNNKNENIYVR